MPTSSSERDSRAPPQEVTATKSGTNHVQEIPKKPVRGDIRAFDASE